MFECENCERSFERTIKIGEEVRCPYCKSSDIVGGEEMEKTEKIVEIIKKEFGKEKPVVFVTEDGTYVKGNGTEVLSLLTCLIQSLHKSGISKDTIKSCCDLAFKNDNELIDELLKILKEIKGELNNE